MKFTEVTNMIIHWVIILLFLLSAVMPITAGVLFLFLSYKGLF